MPAPDHSTLGVPSEAGAAGAGAGAGAGDAWLSAEELVQRSRGDSKVARIIQAAGAAALHRRTHSAAAAQAPALPGALDSPQLTATAESEPVAVAVAAVVEAKAAAGQFAADPLAQALHNPNDPKSVRSMCRASPRLALFCLAAALCCVADVWLMCG